MTHSSLVSRICPNVASNHPQILHSFRGHQTLPVPCPHCRQIPVANNPSSPQAMKVDRENILPRGRKLD
ncbi:hypothetical protein SLE2022_265010 [Rubroshorea leprosula]